MGYQYLNKTNNGIRKTRRPKFRRITYTDLGDGDVKKSAEQTPLVELIGPELNSPTISTLGTSNSFPNTHETVKIDTNLCSVKCPYDSHRDNHNNLTIFMYRADKITNKNQRSSAGKVEDADSYYSIDIKSSSRMQGDENQISSQEDGSDIYKFKPDVTVIDEVYLERIIHLWLKSGLRQHVSQLSNLKLRPVYEWAKRRRLSPEEPEPVLGTLDIEPMHITTERERRSPVTEESPIITKEEKLIPQESKDIDESIFPTIFTKLKQLGKDQRYKIEISTSEGSAEEPPEERSKERPEEVKKEEKPTEEPEDIEKLIIAEQPTEPSEYTIVTIGEEEPEIEEIVIKKVDLQEPLALPGEEYETNIEPSLANVSDSIEKLTAEFADWLIAHGIPLWKISQIGVQTSLEVLPRYKAEPIPAKCRCDESVAVNVDESRETALQILRRILTRVLNQHSNYMAHKLTASVDALENMRKKVCLKMTNYKCIFELKPPLKIQDTKLDEVSDEKNTSTRSESEDQEVPFVTSQSSVKQEMLSIINGIIDQLQNNIKKQITEDYDAVTGSLDESLEEHEISDSFSQKQFPTVPEKPEIIANDENHGNTVRSVSFKEPACSEKENQTETCSRRSTLLKKLSKYVPGQNNKSNKENVHIEVIEENLNTVEDKTPQKRLNMRRSRKYNIHEAFKSLGNRINASRNPNRVSVPIGKVSRKLYSTCEKAEAKLSEKLGISQEIHLRSKPSYSDEISDGPKKQKCKHKLKILIKTGTRNKEIRKETPSKEQCFCGVTYISEKSDYDSTSTQNQKDHTPTEISDIDDMGIQHTSYLETFGSDRSFEDTHVQRLSTNTSVFYSSKHNQHNRTIDSLERRSEKSEIYRRMCFCDFEESKRHHTIFHSRYENKYRRNETRKRNTKISQDDFGKYVNAQNFPPSENIQLDELEIEGSYRESLIFAISSLERLITKLHFKLDSCSDIENRNIHRRTNSTASTIYKEAEIRHSNDFSTDAYASDALSRIRNTSNSIHEEKQMFSTSESSPTLTPKPPNQIFMYRDTTKSENSLLNNFPMSPKNIQSSKSSCKNIKKEAHIKRSLDNFLTDIICSWVSSQTSLSEISSLDLRSRTSTLYDDYIMQHKNSSRTSTKCNKNESSSTLATELSFFGATSNEDTSAFNLFERASQNSFGHYLKPEDVDDVREIIRLLSKLCPRVLCNYYVKKMQS